MTPPLSPAEEQAAEERAIFREFVDVVGLPIVPGSIESRRPREPDILCELVNLGKVAFELGTLDSWSLRKCMSSYDATADALVTRILPPESPKLLALAAKFGPVTLCVDFVADSSVKKREATLPALIDWLIEKAHFSPRTYSVEMSEAFRPPVRGLRVQEGADRFRLVASEIATFTGNETLAILRKKMGGEYKRLHPIELVAHTARQKSGIHKLVRSQIEEIVLDMMGDSPYQRVWIADIWDREAPLLFVHPVPPYVLVPRPRPL
jgi:hypothetical protein